MARRPSHVPGTVAFDESPKGPVAHNRQDGQVDLKGLDPDYGPQSIHRPDLFFINTNHHMNPRQNTEFSPQTAAVSPNPLYPYHQQSFHQYHHLQQTPAHPPKPYDYNHVAYPDHVRRSFTSPVAQPLYPQRVVAPPIPEKPNGYPPAWARESHYPPGAVVAHQGAPIQYSNLQSPAYSGAATSPYATSPAAGYPISHPPPPQAQDAYVAPSHSPSQAPLPSNPYVNHSYAAQPPPLPQNPYDMISNPPPPEALPPNPYTDAPTVTQLPPLSIPAASGPQEVESAASPTDSEELAMALALSQNESQERKMLEERLLNQEEQDLARALAESMLSTGSDLRNPEADPFFPHSQTSSASQTVQGDSGVQLSPLLLETNLPYQPSYDNSETPVTSSASRSTGPTSSNAEYDPDFGRYDKWRIPGASNSPTQQDGAQSEVASGKRPNFSGVTPSRYDPLRQSSGASTARPSSMGSPSTLPYTLPEMPSHKDSLPQYINAEEHGSPKSLASLATEQLSPSALAALESLQHTEAAESVLVFDDESYARQLVAEEEEALVRRIDQKGRAEAQRQEHMTSAATSVGPPVYSQGAETSGSGSSWPTSEKRPKLKRPSTAHAAGRRPSFQTLDKKQSMPRLDENFKSPLSPSQIPEYPPPPFSGNQYQQPSRPSLTTAPTGSSGQSASSGGYSSTGQRRDSDADARSEASYQSYGGSSTNTSERPMSAHPGGPHTPVHTNNFPYANDGAGSSNMQQAAAAGVLNPNHFLDPELLMGVCKSKSLRVLVSLIQSVQPSVSNLQPSPLNYTLCKTLCLISSPSRTLAAHLCTFRHQTGATFSDLWPG